MTRIEWTEHTWNPVVGCSIVSPGCTNCYAMRMAARIEAADEAAYRKRVDAAIERAADIGVTRTAEPTPAAPKRKSKEAA